MRLNNVVPLVVRNCVNVGKYTFNTTLAVKRSGVRAPYAPPKYGTLENVEISISSRVFIFHFWLRYHPENVKNIQK